MKYEEYLSLYKNNLFNDVIPFWLNNSVDREDGGFYTCLDRSGQVFDTDKFMWLQGRQIWTFSMLCDKIGFKEEWKNTAVHGADFILKNGRDSSGNWYFSLDKTGRPLVQPYNIFSDCFASMGLGALYKVEPNPIYAEVAKETFQHILERQHQPKGIYDKSYPGTRSLKNFALPMILSNLSLELEHIIDESVIESLLDKVIHEVMDVFYDPSTGLILEHVTLKGAFSDSFEGRLLNPGHVLEAMWFIMDLAVRRNDNKLVDRCVEIALHTLNYGWDKQHNGILYFMDVKGNPPQQLEWDQKLWWVHIEAMIVMLKGYLHTDNEQCWEWFERLHQYTFKHFVDDSYGEWFGYLNRQGEALLTLKGGKWKGCFHVPRGLYQLINTMEKIITKKQENLKYHGSTLIK